MNKDGCVTVSWGGMNNYLLTPLKEPVTHRGNDATEAQLVTSGLLRGPRRCMGKRSLTRAWMMTHRQQLYRKPSTGWAHKALGLDLQAPAGPSFVASAVMIAFITFCNLVSGTF